MRASLSDFLADLARQPFGYGVLDCALMLADWWQVNHGSDPAAHLRGAYVDEASCSAILSANRNLPRLVEKLARSVGARRTTKPVPGDFAVVRHAGRWWGAIRTQAGFWAIKAHRGIAAIRDCRVVAAWSI